MITRVFEGVGNHFRGQTQDALRTQELTAPNDREGTLFVTMGDLFPLNLRVDKWCAGWGKKCLGIEGVRAGYCIYKDPFQRCRPPRFKFKITVELEEIK